MTQAMGKATREAQVPGNFGNNPTPNHVAIKDAGCLKLGRFGGSSLDDGILTPALSPNASSGNRTASYKDAF